MHHVVFVPVKPYSCVVGSRRVLNFVTTIPIANIRPFEDNPYKVQDNEEMQFLCERISFRLRKPLRTN